MNIAPTAHSSLLSRSPALPVGTLLLCALGTAACQQHSPTIPDPVDVSATRVRAGSSGLDGLFDAEAWGRSRLPEPAAVDRREAVILVDNNGQAGEGPGYQRADYVLMGIDCFGLRRGELCDEIGARAGLELGKPLPMGWTGRGAAERIRDGGQYVYVALSPHFSADGMAWVTVDVVAREERDRLSVNMPPTETTVISSNLLQVYGSFSNLRVQLLRSGLAPAFRIEGDTWEPDEPRLAAFAALFRAEVPRNRDDLIKVLLRDREPSRRRAAAGLLGYDRRDDATADALELALLDPDVNVRQEAATALTPRLHHAATAGASVIAVGPVARLLKLPTATDRTSAAALLAEMALVPSLRPQIRQDAAPVLLQMLRSSRGNVVDQAVMVLERTSGESWGNDAERWAEVLGQ